jgi:two-component system response regulator DctR
VRTVEVHRARVFEKMDVKSAVELANLLRDV